MPLTTNITKHTPTTASTRTPARAQSHSESSSQAKPSQEAQQQQRIQRAGEHGCERFAHARHKARGDQTSTSGQLRSTIGVIKITPSRSRRQARGERVPVPQRAARMSCHELHRSRAATAVMPCTSKPSANSSYEHPLPDVRSCSAPIFCSSMACATSTVCVTNIDPRRQGSANARNVSSATTATYCLPSRPR